MRISKGKQEELEKLRDYLNNSGGYNEVILHNGAVLVKSEDKWLKISIDDVTKWMRSI